MTCQLNEMARVGDSHIDQEGGNGVIYICASIIMN